MFVVVVVYVSVCCGSVEVWVLVTVVLLVDVLRTGVIVEIGVLTT